MAVLIDSSVFIGLERRGLPLEAIDRLGISGVPVLASITASELLNGVERAVPSPRRTGRLRFIERIFSTLTIIPFDRPAARQHAQIGAYLAATGTPIGPNDLIIAATALTHGHQLLTDNVREFRRVLGPIVGQPTWST